MKIGDLVVRAYAWPSLDIGIVVDNIEIRIEDELLGSIEENDYDYNEHVIKWSSGEITQELPEELDYLEDVYEDLVVVYEI